MSSYCWFGHEKIALLPRVFDPPLPAIISGRSSVGSTRFSESFRFQNDSIYLFQKLGSNSVFPQRSITRNMTFAQLLQKCSGLYFAYNQFSSVCTSVAQEQQLYVLYLYNNRARVIFLSLGPESFAQNDGSVFCNAMNAKAMDERTDVGRCPPLRDTLVGNVVQQQQH